MKTKIRVLKEITIDQVCVVLPVRYEEDDMPNDFPFRDGETWKATIEVDTGKIIGWPLDAKWQRCEIENMKVCDGGIYVLYDEKGNAVAKLEDYVPHGLIPGEHGDYVGFKILNGFITNWPKKPSVSAFFTGSDEP